MQKPRLYKRPIPALLIQFPLYLLVLSALFDAAYLLTNSQNGTLPEISFWLIAAGIVTGVAAIIWGVIDWMSLSQQTIRKYTDLWGGAGSIAAAALFFLSWIIRVPAIRHPDPVAFVLSFIGVGLVAIKSFVGRALIHTTPVEESDTEITKQHRPKPQDELYRPS